MPDVINLVHANNVDMRQMVYLDVQVVDFKKSALSNIGINWQKAISGPVLGVVGDVVHNPYYRIGDVTQGGSTTNQLSGSSGVLQGLPNHTNWSGFVGLTSSLSSVLNLAVQNGDAYILANPQLSTRSGGEAKFLAGGEVPIPVTSGGFGQVTVQYKKYGVQLNIKPEADANQNILAAIDTEVSQIDPSVNINGYPGFLTRNTSSVVNVHSHQTIVLSGLIQATGATSVDAFPWLGSIPILGRLFSNHNFQGNRDELVIFVTPVTFDPDSKVNREAVGVATDAMKRFNDGPGSDLYMPGFGVGPGSHLQPPGHSGKDTDEDDESTPVVVKHQAKTQATIKAPVSRISLETQQVAAQRGPITPALLPVTPEKQAGDENLANESTDVDGNNTVEFKPQAVQVNVKKVARSVPSKSDAVTDSDRDDSVAAAHGDSERSTSENGSVDAASEQPWLVQVARGSVRRFAVASVERLEHKGFKAQVVDKGSTSFQRYCIRVGPYATEDLARQASVSLAEAGYKHALVIHPLASSAASMAAIQAK